MQQSNTATQPLETPSVGPHDQARQHSASASKERNRSRAKTAQNAVGLTPLLVIECTGSTVTVARHALRHRRKRKCVCGQDISGRRPQARFCSSKCRQKAYRVRQAKQRRNQPQKARELNQCTCHWCDHGFFTTSKSAKFCTPYHRQLAYRKRRESAIAALAVDMRISQVESANLLEILGLAKINAYLISRGFNYDAKERKWIQSGTSGSALTSVKAADAIVRFMR